MLALRLAAIILAIVVLAGAAYLAGLIALIIAASFAIAAANASPRPPDMRLGLPAKAMLWAGEYLAALCVMVVFLPFERWLMRRDAPVGRADTSPVLLIHGYVNNAGAMFILWRRLIHSGFGVHTVNLEPVYGDIDGYCALIERRLAQIQERSGAAKVSLVCHSMGGLAARAYLRRHGGARVARVITLGTPHAGTVHARTALGENGRQMRPGSAWLADLARHEGGAWPCPLVSIFSRDDNFVAPQESSRLAGARNIALAGIGHIALPLSSGVAKLVIDELQAPEAGRPGA